MGGDGRNCQKKNKIARAKKAKGHNKSVGRNRNLFAKDRPRNKRGKEIILSLRALPQDHMDRSVYRTLKVGRR